ncbi:MAG: hypothetical protein [Caudoviricetes sp.]|nr:MAG: hypothetical protein [Caudoviricetes sp.]
MFLLGCLFTFLNFPQNLKPHLTKRKLVKQPNFCYKNIVFNNFASWLVFLFLFVIYLFALSFTSDNIKSLPKYDTGQDTKNNIVTMSYLV